jgi:hypothetical protein
LVCATGRGGEADRGICALTTPGDPPLALRFRLRPSPVDANDSARHVGRVVRQEKGDQGAGVGCLSGAAERDAGLHHGEEAGIAEAVRGEWRLNGTGR